MESQNFSELAQNPSEPNLDQHVLDIKERAQESSIHTKEHIQHVSHSIPEGAGEIFRRSKELFQETNAVLIALGGPSRSGKGFLSEQLSVLAKKEGIGVCSIPMDWFYLLKAQRDALEAHLYKEVTFDDPESIWYERLHLTLNALKQGATDVLFPDYLYQSQPPYRIWQDNVVLPTQEKKMYIIDGIFAGHPLGGVPDCSDIHVHMKADGASQVLRRIQIDRQRGRKTVDAAHIFLDFVAAKRKEHIDPYAMNADIVIQNTMPAEELLQRASIVDQTRVRFSETQAIDASNIVNALDELGYIESGFEEYLDAYTSISGREDSDYGRLRFAYGSAGLHSAEFGLSLYSKEGKNHRSSYNLYPQTDHANKYLAGMMAAFEVDRGVAVWKKRITMTCGNACIALDTDIQADHLHEPDLVSDNQFRTPSKDSVSLPLQMGVVGATAKQWKDLDRLLRKQGTQFLSQPFNTYQVAQSRLPKGQ